MENTPNPKCPRCNCYWKPDETDIKTSGLPYKSCQKCRETSKKYREKNADKISERKKKYYEENADIIAERKKKYYHQNADKIKEKRKQYYDENFDKIAEQRKKYYEENVDKIKEYRKENADKIAEQMKKYYEKKKCKHNKHYGWCKICNLQLYLIYLQRGQLRRCLNNSSFNKTKSSIEYLGCDAEYFIEYMKKKMDIWNETNEVKMNFDNIHIDHIKPISAFNLDDEDQFLDCCNYTNIQPLLVNDNLSKHNKWTDDDDIYWCNNIINKEYLNIYIC